MTDAEAVNLIETVFVAHWPNWIFSPEETAVWVANLRRYDFAKAKAAINNFYMSQTRQGKPAPGQLLMALRKNARIHSEKRINEPVRLFEIIAEGKNRGQNFFRNQPIPADQEIEETAEGYRKAFNILYGDNHIIIRHWDRPPEDKKSSQVLTGTERKEAVRRCITAAASGFVDKVPF